jgi:phospholipase C
MAAGLPGIYKRPRSVTGIPGRGWHGDFVRARRVLGGKRFHRMSRKQIWKATCAGIAMIGMMENTLAVAAEPVLTNATSTTSAGYAIETVPSQETPLSAAKKLKLLQQNIKYVFVLFQENRSFDHYFGTYPGANGLFSTYTGADPTDPQAQPATATASFTQNIRYTDGTYQTVTPFLAPRTIVDVHGATIQLYPESIYSVDHSHTGYMGDFHLQDLPANGGNLSVPKNDGYALDQEGLEYLSASSSTTGGNVVLSGSTVPPPNSPPTSNPSLQAYQKGLVVMAHGDCDVIPFLWHYADVGTLFDNMHQTITGPSTPNAIAMIAAQSGATQWALHPSTTGTHTASYTVPNETDSQPYPGSTSDNFAGKPPDGPDEASFGSCAVSNTGAEAGTYNNANCPEPNPTYDPSYADWANPDAITALKKPLTAYASPQLTLTFASLPLSFMGSQIASIVKQDVHPSTDLVDIGQDIVAIATKNPAVSWGWYQQGFGPEPFDANSAKPEVVDTFPSATPHSSYIVHHNGPQYFGYLGDNPVEVANMHGLQQFYTDIANQALPANGGVFYVRGGYYNNDGLTSYDPSPAARANFNGNDDHGSYSDSQISESLVADSVNAIANSKYWANSAIIISWDESDGFYDHQPESIRSWGADGLPMSGGARIPTIVISPFSAVHTVSHVYNEHGAIIKFINELFGLTPLSSLPDERKGKRKGAAEFTSPNGSPQTALAPNDGPGVGDLMEAFDNDKLLGNTPVLPASTFTIPASTVTTLPHFGGAGCSTLGITPTDYPNGYGTGAESDPPPTYFNPRPTVAPGIPYLEQTIISGGTTTPWTP